MQLMGNLDVFFLVKELSSLKGTRLDNVYQTGEKDFRFRFAGKQDLVIRLGECVFLGERKPAPKQPSQFAMLLRKHLRNRRLTSVEQLNFDRLLVLHFDEKAIVIELFSKGNLLLIEENTIVRPFKFEEFSARTLRPKEKYSPPPSTKKDPSMVDLPSSGEAVPALSKKINLPPFYLEEACCRANVGFKEELTEQNIIGIKDELIKLIDEKLNPVLYFENGKPIAFSPFELSKLSGKESKKFESFNAALCAYYSSFKIEVEPVKDFVKEQRLQAITEFNKKAGEARETGDWISQNAFQVNQAIKLVNQKKISEAQEVLGKKIKREGKKLRIESM